MTDMYYTKAARNRSSRIIGAWAGGAALALAVAGFAVSHRYTDAHGVIAGSNFLPGVGSIFGGLILALVAIGRISSRAQFAQMRMHRRNLQPICESRYGRELADARHVGVSPGPELGNYDSDSAWDIGFLVLEDGMLTYLGDQTSFQIAPNRIQSIEMRANSALLGRGYPRLYVSFAPSTDGTEIRWFSIEYRDARSVTDLWKATADLQSRIRELRDRHMGSTGPRQDLPVEMLGAEGKRMPTQVPIPLKYWLLIMVPTMLIARTLNIGGYGPLLVLAVGLTAGKLFIWLNQRKSAGS